MSVTRWLLRLCGPALLIGVVLSNDVSNMWSLLQKTELRLIVFSVVLGLLLLYLKGMRWKMILAGWNISISNTSAAILYSLGGFIGALTPGQSGDLIKAWYLHQDGYPLGPSLLSIVIDRGFDVGTMCLAALSGLYFYRAILPGRFWATNLVILIGVVGALLIIRSRHTSFALMSQILANRMPKWLRSFIRLDEFQRFPLALTLQQLFRIILVSCGALGCTFVRLYLVSLSIGLRIPIGAFVALVAVTTLAGLFSFAGVGTRDIAMLVTLRGLVATHQEVLFFGNPLMMEQVSTISRSSVF